MPAPAHWIEIEIEHETSFERAPLVLGDHETSSLKFEVTVGSLDVVNGLKRQF